MSYWRSATALEWRAIQSGCDDTGRPTRAPRRVAPVTLGSASQHRNGGPFHGRLSVLAPTALGLSEASPRARAPVQTNPRVQSSRLTGGASHARAYRQIVRPGAAAARQEDRADGRPRRTAAGAGLQRARAARPEAGRGGGGERPVHRPARARPAG